MPDFIFPQTLIGRIVWPILIAGVFVLYYVGGVYSRVETSYFDSTKKETWECYQPGTAVKKENSISITLTTFDVLSTFSTLPVYLEIERKDEKTTSNSSITFKFSSNTLYFCLKPASRSTCEPEYTVQLSQSDIKKVIFLYAVVNSNQISTFSSSSMITIKPEQTERSRDTLPFQCSRLNEDGDQEDTIQEEIHFEWAQDGSDRYKIFARSVVGALLLPPWANFVLPVATTYFIVLGEQLWRFLLERLEEDNYP